MGATRVKALIQANRNGFFYALDRGSGKFLLAKAYTKVTWADGIGVDGRPILISGQDPSEEGTRACPGLGGGHNWQPTAYSPQIGLYYFHSTDGCQLYYKTKQDFLEGQWYQASTADSIRSEHSTGAIVAVDPKTGDTKWRFDMVSSTAAGLLATAGGLVFGGDGQGYLIAFDGRSGKVLWKFQTGGGISAPPISYALNGRQYIAIAAGQAFITFALPR
jgi:alcohol dehydrogenase (cytochrome c)